MKRLLAAAALAVTIAGPVAAQDAAKVDPYVADFTRLCLDTGGEREAVRAAVAAAGWTPGTPPGTSPNAVDMAVWDSPDGGAQLMTSASPPDQMSDGLVVRTCILKPDAASAPPRDPLGQAAAQVIGLPGLPTRQGLVWVLSGARQDGFVDETTAFLGTGSADAGLALGAQRPIMVVNVIGGPDVAALSLLRVSRE
jgi:hypothetical protein